eukprot:COSAG06_NODE_29437_length_556_cov_1.203501_2_plen_67_part_01
MTILPRQARDKHKGSTQNRKPFMQAEAPSWAAARGVRSQYDPKVPRNGVETDGGREQRGRDDREPGS